MKMNSQKIILFSIMFIFVLTFFGTISFASQTLNTNEYKTDLQYDEASYLFNKGAVILKLLRNIAAVVSVVTLSIIGVRYMVGSIEQRAEYKQTMMPVVIGCILIGALSAILSLIQSIF